MATLKREDDEGASSQEEARSLESPAPGDLTRLLHEWRNSSRIRNHRVAGDLFSIIYRDLEKIAQTVDFSRSSDPRALVNELYTKWQNALLSEPWANRAEFFGMARQAMKRLLIDRYRGEQRSVLKVALEDRASATAEVDYSLVEEILCEIGQESPHLETVLSLKIFTEHTDEDIAEMLDVSEATVKRFYKVGKSEFKERLKKKPLA